LDDYRAYTVKNNTHCDPVHTFFDNWKDVLDRFKSKSQGYVDAAGKPKSLVRKCSELNDQNVSNRNDKLYIELTGDTHLSCDEDMVWFSKSCREKPSTCVPLVIQYTYDFAIQISWFLEMPLAVMYIEPGKTGNYAEYYEVIQEMKVIFGWYQPDDFLILDGKVPLPVRLPRTNQEEHANGIYKTGLGENLMRSYAWRNLPNVDKALAHFGSNINFFHQDLEAMMTRSKALKNELTGGATWNKKPSGLPGIGPQGFTGSWADLGFDDEKLDLALVGRIVACEWVRNNTAKWRNWLPAFCGPGTLSNLALTGCSSCAKGYFCPGYNSKSLGAGAAVLCPVGHFCPTNSSEPQQCDRGRTSERGSSSEADCGCSASSVWISNVCRPVVGFLLPVVILPILVVLALLFAVHMFVKRRSVKVDPYEELMRLRAIDLRAQLEITRQHGYILSTDKIFTWSRSRYVIIPQRLMDSAVRLTVLEDFDLDAFDAFCVLVANAEYDAVSFITTLIDRMGDFDTPVRTRSASPSNETGLYGLQASLSTKKFQAPSLPHLTLLRQWLLDLASKTLAKISIVKQEGDTEKRRQSVKESARDMSGQQLYEYLRTKVLKVRIFRDDSCSLFVELKQHVQVFMNQIAGKCNAHVRKMVSEPGGSDLCTFVFVPGKGIILGRSQDDVVTAQQAVLRQDDERVEAVRTGPNDELEREMEMALPEPLKYVNEFGVRRLFSDSVHITQLHRRALLLDRAFKTKVWRRIHTDLCIHILPLNPNHPQTKPFTLHPNQILLPNPTS